MAANRPDIDSKLASIVSLGVAGPMHYTKNPLIEMYSRYWRSFESSIIKTGDELWGKGFQERFANTQYHDTLYMVENAFWKSFAANKEYDDPDRIQAYMGHFPGGGTSARLLDHLG